MIDRCDRVLAYTHELTREKFDERGLAYDATLRNIELLGEAARHIPEEERCLKLLIYGHMLCHAN